MRRVLVTGGAGFIGSNLADRLAGMGIPTVVYDNFSTGFGEFLSQVSGHPDASVVEGDLLDPESLVSAMEGCDTVFHLAANADVRYGLEHPQRDLEQNAIATSNVLEAMRATGCERIVFTSTASVYGEPSMFPTPESCPFPAQTSLYATSKLAAEGLIQSYSHGFGFQALIFRLVSNLGERYTHGHVIDFYKSLKQDPHHLTVLGDGRQRKSYLYVQDCIDGMLAALDSAPEGEASVHNLGSEETVTVDDSIKVITDYMGVSPEFTHAGGTRGWPGDSPMILLDCSRLRSLGWRPKVSTADGIRRTLAWLDANPWIFDGRGDR